MSRRMLGPGEVRSREPVAASVKGSDVASDQTTPGQPGASIAERQGLGPDRRSVLRVTAAVGVVGAAAPLLAACGSDTPTAASPAQTTPAAGGAASGATTIVAANDVPVGGSVVKIVEDRKVIVTQPIAGQFKAFSAICTHNGCTVKGVDQGSILCVCHGSRFDETTGAVVQGPAQAPLASIPVVVRSGDVDFA
jgi:Rieske Fe-S protein